MLLLKGHMPQSTNTRPASALMHLWEAREGPPKQRGPLPAPNTLLARQRPQPRLFFNEKARFKVQVLRCQDTRQDTKVIGAYAGEGEAFFLCWWWTEGTYFFWMCFGSGSALVEIQPLGVPKYISPPILDQCMPATHLGVGACLGQGPTAPLSHIHTLFSPLIL
jgi:hypothetical protein